MARMLVQARYFWILVGALLLVVAATTVSVVLGRTAQLTLLATRDSLAVAKADVRRWQVASAQRDSLYRLAAERLDTALRHRPKILYLPGPATVDTLIDTVPLIPGGSGQGATVDPRTGTVAYVPLADYSALQTRCQAVQTTCAATIEAKDSTIAALTRQYEAFQDVNEALRRRSLTGIRHVVHDAKVGTIGGAIGFVGGFLIGSRR